MELPIFHGPEMFLKAYQKGGQKFRLNTRIVAVMSSDNTSICVFEHAYLFVLTHEKKELKVLSSSCTKECNF